MRAVDGDTGALTTTIPVRTVEERAVLDAYLAPLRAGHPRRATHDEAARVLGRSESWIRTRAAHIYDKFFLAPVPMRDFPVQLDAIVDAAWRHGL